MSGTKLRLVIEMAATRPRDARALAGVVADYAEEQFETFTMEHGRPMSMRSWIVKPTKSGEFQ